MKLLLLVISALLYLTVLSVVKKSCEASFVSYFCTALLTEPAFLSSRSFTFGFRDGNVSAATRLCVCVCVCARARACVRVCVCVCVCVCV